MKLFSKFSRNRGITISFIGSKALISILPLLAIPITIDISSYDYWIKVATIQVIAIFLSLFIEAKWPSMTQNEVKEYLSQNLFFTEIFRQKLLLYMILNLGIVTVWKISPIGFDFTLFLSMQPILTAAFSNGWYWLITGTPNKYFRNEMMPKILIGLFSLAILLAFKNLNVYFFILGLLQILISKIGFKFVKGVNRHKISMRDHFIYAFSRAIQSIYSLLTLPLVSFLSPASLVFIVANDRIYRFSMTALVPFQQSLISTVTRKKVGISRFRNSFLLQIFLLAIFLIVLSSSFVNNLIFRGMNNYNGVILVYFILGFFVILNRSLNSFYLISRINLKESVLAKINFRSGFTTLILIYPSNYYFGFKGILVIFVLAEVLVSLGYFFALRNSDESWRENE